MTTRNIYKIALFITISIYPYFQTELNAQINETDSLALVALYNATDGDNWTDNSNWLTGPVNAWFGITISGNRVTEISFQVLDQDFNSIGNNLNGTLPAEIGNLSALTRLSINLNDNLTGSIPSEIGNLTNIIEIELISNSLTGSIPAEIGNLSSLESLDLEGNSLSGNIPPEIGNLASLISLDLEVNQLSGSIPIEIGNLTSLIVLELSNNALSGTIPTEIGNIGVLASFGIDVDLSNNQFSGEVPSSLFLIPTLFGLYLSDNINLSGDVPLGIINSTNLDDLDLSNTSICEPLNSTEYVSFVIGLNEFSPDSYVPSNACQEINIQDSLALVALYNSAGGINWGETDADDQIFIPFEHWLINPISTWEGVFLANDRVYNLDLREKNLSGSIPVEIGDLSALNYLDLGNVGFVSDPNTLTGTIPSTIINLTELIELNISGNQLTGTIPGGIGAMRKLKELRLGGNQLSGSIPSAIGNLSNLETLFLSRNNLSGSIPTAIGDLINLEEFSIEDNNISGSIPSSIGSMVNLKYFDASYNELTGTIPSTIGDLLNLEGLYLFNNALSGSIPPEIGNLITTEILLNDNNLEGFIPPELSNLTASLDLSNNPGLVGMIPPELSTQVGNINFENTNVCASPDIPDSEIWNIQQGIPLCEEPSFEDFDALFNIYEHTDGDNWTNNQNWLSGPVHSWYGVAVQNGRVVRLDLSDNGLDNTTFTLGAVTFGGLTGLKHLDLSNNNLKSWPEDEWAIGDLTVLEHLDLSGNDIVRTDFPLEVAQLTTLKYMDLSDIVITEPLPTAIGNLSNLKYLYLDDMLLTDVIPAEIGNLSNLKLLSMIGNQFSQIPPEIGNLASLEELYLNNQLNGKFFDTSIPPELGNLSSLKVLFLGGNEFIGSIPSELGSLNNLERLSLSRNNLTGTIPPELGNLSSLQQLFLYDNELNGSIPAELGNLSELTYLGLYTNQLTGAIPTDLGNLESLEFLYLHENGLSGEIPEELGTLERLQDLWLSTNQLSGQIPESFGNLSNLEDLIVHDNQFTGVLPESVGNIQTLDRITIDRNIGLSGEIPSSWLDLNLSLFYFFDTDICESATTEFSFWKSSVSDFQGTNVTCVSQNSDPIIANQTFSVDENSANGTSVGTVIASDPDDDPLTYSITAGNTGTTFAINSSTGALTISDNILLDFETNPSFSLTVTVDDGNSGSASATITVNLNDLDENQDPTIADQTFTVDENSDNGTSIGTVIASDPDDDPLTYSITAGNTGTTLAINSSTGELSVNDNTLLDFETNPSFGLTVMVEDGNSGSASGTITVNLNDLDENGEPTIADQTFSIDENSDNGTSVGTVIASDPDDDPLTYSITAGNTGTTLAINSSTGELTIADNTLLDFETNPTFSLTVNVDDGNSGSASATITVNLNDLDENGEPTIADQTFSIDENSANGTSVGTVIASDPDDDPLTYSITAGNTGTTFAINSSTGDLTIADNTLLDFETNPSFSLTISVDDGNSGSASATITVNLNDLDENGEPTIEDQTFTIDENSSNGTSVGTVIASDPDDDPLTYSITAGNTASTFAINSSTGELTIADNTLLDFETNPTFSLTVTVEDGNSGSASGTITINLNDINEAVLGLDEDKIGVNIYPNPITDEFSLSDFSEFNPEWIVLHGLSGRKMKEFLPNSSNKYSISDLQPGIYLISIIKQGSLIKLGRVIKE